MSTARFAALGALAGLGQGVAQIGAAQGQAIAAREEAARRQAEWDRQQLEKDRYFQSRLALRDAYGDENAAQRAALAGTAAPTARGSRGSAAGGWADVRQLPDQDLADEMALASGMDRQGALNAVRAARGRMSATDIVDDEFGAQQIESRVTATDEERSQGARAFRMRFNLDKPEQMAQSEFMLATGRKMDSRTPEQIAAEVAAREAQGAKALADAAAAPVRAQAAATNAAANQTRASRPPSGGGGGGGKGGDADARAVLNSVTQSINTLSKKASRTPAEEAELAGLQSRRNALSAHLTKAASTGSTPAARTPAQDARRASFKVVGVE